MDYTNWTERRSRDVYIFARDLETLYCILEFQEWMTTEKTDQDDPRQLLLESRKRGATTKMRSRSKMKSQQPGTETSTARLSTPHNTLGLIIM